MPELSAILVNGLNNPIVSFNIKKLEAFPKLVSTLVLLAYLKLLSMFSMAVPSSDALMRPNEAETALCNCTFGTKT